jgi:hypothetical protein
MSSIIVTAPADTIGSVKSLASVERFMQSIHGKSPDAQMVAHLRAIHEHVLSLLGTSMTMGTMGMTRRSTIRISWRIRATTKTKSKAGHQLFDLECW